ncbi:unnamed protein product [marine sediment metagenome]|uniref:Uncharacterized protein n=1 Tax=marine sediment metagenome TaxID=412755 RepID=X0VJY9_9ZZZZ
MRFYKICLYYFINNKVIKRYIYIKYPHLSMQYILEYQKDIKGYTIIK